MRAGFGVTVLVGLAGSGLTAVAGSRAWASVPSLGDDGANGFAVLGESIADSSAPLTTALALVCLAAWGVVLVSRGLFRRLVAGLGLVAAAGMLASGVAAWFQAPDAVRDALAQVGATSLDVDHTVWSYLGLVTALVAVVAAAQAVRKAPEWPEMGRRYDAPGTDDTPVRAPEVPLEEQTSLDVWKSLDEGRDPTDRPRSEDL